MIPRRGNPMQETKNPTRQHLHWTRSDGVRRDGVGRRQILDCRTVATGGLDNRGGIKEILGESATPDFSCSLFLDIVHLPPVAHAHGYGDMGRPPAPIGVVDGETIY